MENFAVNSSSHLKKYNNRTFIVFIIASAAVHALVILYTNLSSNVSIPQQKSYAIKVNLKIEADQPTSNITSGKIEQPTKDSHNHSESTTDQQDKAVENINTLEPVITSDINNQNKTSLVDNVTDVEVNPKNKLSSSRETLVHPQQQPVDEKIENTSEIPDPLTDVIIEATTEKTSKNVDSLIDDSDTKNKKVITERPKIELIETVENNLVENNHELNSDVINKKSTKKLVSSDNKKDNSIPLPRFYSQAQFQGNSPSIKTPKLAIKKRLRGLTTLHGLVDLNGVLIEVTLYKSSGYKILDESAMQQAKTWKFQPAVIDGVNVKQWVKIPIQFR